MGNQTARYMGGSTSWSHGGKVCIHLGHFRTKSRSLSLLTDGHLRAFDLGVPWQPLVKVSSLTLDFQVLASSSAFVFSCGPGFPSDQRPKGHVSLPSCLQGMPICLEGHFGGPKRRQSPKRRLRTSKFARGQGNSCPFRVPMKFGFEIR